MDSVTHMAGPRVIYHGRLIQRCLVCGEKLSDEDIEDSNNTALINALSHPCDHFIRFGGGVCFDLGPVDPNVDPPEDWCFALVER